MCNLYTNKASAAEVAALFKAQIPINFNAGEGDVYPGGQGMIVREENGARIVQSMVWGWPRPMKSKVTGQPIKPKAVNNIADLNGYPWRFIASKPEHRCLIPLTGFCEAEGEKGAMTRTWFGVKGKPIFAWAGMWDRGDTWGNWYSGLMTNCNEVVRPVHDRMPVLLHEEDYDRWLHGSLEDVIGFQDRCFPDELTALERTAELWFKRKSAEAPASLV
jgi:putative SOS response-associated peptidase YedK